MLVQLGFDPQCVTMTTGLLGCCLATNFVFCLPQMRQVSPETAVNAIKLELVVCTVGHILLCGQNLFLLGCNCGYNMGVNCSELWFQVLCPSHGLIITCDLITDKLRLLSEVHLSQIFRYPRSQASPSFTFTLIHSRRVRKTGKGWEHLIM